MQLSQEQILQNKEDFLNILIPVIEKREGSKPELLVTTLENSDFFIAPASTKYHGAYKGGLVDHCLKVYYNLWSIIMAKGLQDVIDRESVVIVALLHDLSKRNYYEPICKNTKVYCKSQEEFNADPKGWKLYDNLGHFRWESSEGFGTRPIEERFVYGNHEETAEFMVRQFTPLKYEESIAILSHMGGMSFDSKQGNIGEIYDRYALACLLHVADMMSSYVDKA